MANLIQKNDFLPAQKQILVADETAVTFGVQVGNTGLTADANGKKILKAGTPIKGDWLDRDTAFVKATTSTSGEGANATQTSNANAVLLHDVDVTAGDVNGTAISVGHIDMLKLDSDVQALITAPVITALKAEGIKFIKGSKV